MFKTLKGNDNTKVSILGYASELVEYKKGFHSKIYHDNTSIGLLISAVNGQRLYTNNKWPNPIVLKIEDVEYLAPGKSVKMKSGIDGAK